MQAVDVEEPAHTIIGAFLLLPFEGPIDREKKQSWLPHPLPLRLLGWSPSNTFKIGLTTGFQTDGPENEIPLPLRSQQQIQQQSVQLH